MIHDIHVCVHSYACMYDATSACLLEIYSIDQCKNRNCISNSMFELIYVMECNGHK
jgi:hypothetical protein